MVKCPPNYTNKVDSKGDYCAIILTVGQQKEVAILKACVNLVAFLYRMLYYKI